MPENRILTPFEERVLGRVNARKRVYLDMAKGNKQVLAALEKLRELGYIKRQKIPDTAYCSLYD